MRPAHLALCILLLPAAARALDPFEIQVYDGTANPKGVAGVELHANEADSTAHFTLEPSYGVAEFWELGAYLQSAVRPDGTFDFAGAKLRSKFVTPQGFDPRWRLGVNFELSLLPRRYDPERFGGEIRPIAAWESDSLLFAVNPIVGLSLTGNGPSFEPAAMARFKLRELVAFGVEYYSSLSSPQRHYLFEVIDVLAVKRLEINLGIGQGLTSGSSNLVFKAIIGWTFEPPPSGASR